MQASELDGLLTGVVTSEYHSIDTTWQHTWKKKTYGKRDVAYGGEAADTEAPRRRRDLDDLVGVLVLLALPLPLPVPAVLVLPAYHRETRLHAV